MKIYIYIFGLYGWDGHEAFGQTTLEEDLQENHFTVSLEVALRSLG